MISMTYKAFLAYLTRLLQVFSNRRRGDRKTKTRRRDKKILCSAICVASYSTLDSRSSHRQGKERQMTEDTSKQPQTISRDDLYRQVWQTRASRLCAQYGISGRGLKKIYDRLNVPSPPRGYWARLAAGQRIKQTPLPDAAPGAVLKVTITPSISETPAAPALDTETDEKLQAARAAAADIAVPAKLSRPHPAIAAWIARHQREITHDRTVWGRTLTALIGSNAHHVRQSRWLRLAILRTLGLTIIFCRTLIHFLT
jgi:hypothetical protein